MRTIFTLLTLCSLAYVPVQAQSVSALNINLSRQVSNVQPNLPDSTFNLIGFFQMSDSLNVSEMRVSVREHFQDTISAASFISIDTLDIFQSHPILQRTGNTVSFSYPGILSDDMYFFQVDFINYNGVRIGRTIEQF